LGDAGCKWPERHEGGATLTSLPSSTHSALPQIRIQKRKKKPRKTNTYFVCSESEGVCTSASSLFLSQAVFLKKSVKCVVEE